MRRWLILVVVLVLVAAGVVFVARPFASAAQAVRTATVTRGTIVSAVDLSGTLQSPTVDELSFGAAGTVTGLKVKVGDKVAAGQVLATIDHSLLDAQLAAAKAQLAAAKARLVVDQAGPTTDVVAAAADSVTQANLALKAAQQAVSDTAASNKLSVAAAQMAVTIAKNQLAADQAGLPADQVAPLQDAITQAQQNLANAQQSFSDLQAQDAQSLQAAQVAVANAQLKLINDQAVRASQSVQTADQQAVTAAQSAYDATQLKITASEHQAQAQINSAQQALTTAQHNYDLKSTPSSTTIAADQQALATAQQNLDAALQRAGQAQHQAANQVASGQASVAAAATGYQTKVAPATPDQIASDQQALASAQGGLVSAQQAADSAAIKSPIAGTVTAVNIVVGQHVSAGPGAASAASGATGLIEVTDLSSLQIVGQAAETDVVKLSLGQPATITADALGTSTVTGSVCAISPVGVAVQGVTSYDVNVCPDVSNPSLLVGMSASASVIVQRHDNALLVPSLAIVTSAGQQTVNVVGTDGKPVAVQVQTGLTNGQQTEVVSGVQEGQTVRLSLPSAGGTQNGGGGGGGPGIFRGFGG